MFWMNELLTRSVDAASVWHLDLQVSGVKGCEQNVKGIAAEAGFNNGIANWLVFLYIENKVNATSPVRILNSLLLVTGR